VRLSPAGGSVPSLTWQTLASIAIGGLVCALVVLVGGWGVRRAVFGSDDAQARARVEADVRSMFDAMARTLRDAATAVADPVLVRAAADDDTAATNQLLTRAADVVARTGASDAALTVYDTDGTPLAWAGRPSDLFADRLQGGEAWFPAPVTQGLRLVYVQPVVGNGVRVGTIAVEQPLPSVDGSNVGTSTLQGTDGDAFRVPTRLAPVSIQLPFEGAPPAGDAATTFDVQTPSGAPLLTASVASGDLASTRERWRQATWSLMFVIVAITLLLLAAPLLDWRNRLRSPPAYVLSILLVIACIVAARFVFFEAALADWSDALVFSAAAYASALLGSLLTSPFDFLLTAGAAVALVVLLLYGVEAWRVYAWRRRQSPIGTARLATYIATQLVCGVIVAIVLLGHQALLSDTVSHTSLDLLHLSLNPWNSTRVTLQIGILFSHVAALGLCVLVFRTARAGWRVPRGHIRLRLLTVACWLLPLVTWQAIQNVPAPRRLPLLMAGAAAVVLAAALRRLVARYRHGSQAFRLALLTLPLIAPAFAFYPTIVQLAGQAKTELVETSYAPEVRSQRQTIQSRLQRSQSEIDQFPGLVELVTTPVSPGDEALTDRAFRLWQTTGLARYPIITSSVEVYGPDSQLVSRFAFNLPEDPAATPLFADEQSCDWQVLEEVAPFFAEERRVLHAGRALCSDTPGAPVLGSIIVHVMPDFENLSFISSRSPYLELLRTADPLRGEGLSARDVEFAAYGWSRTPFYPIAGTAWSLPDDIFARVEESRTPFWATLTRGQDLFDVYLFNDRGGIYALGFPVISALGHLVNLAELTVLAVGAYVLLLLLNALFNRLGRRVTTAPALLREVRASFYRKLFLAFVAAVFVPVVALVLVTRNYVAGQMQTSIEQEAVRTATAAGRVVEDLAAPRAAQQGFGVDDNLMVWVSRLIDQDVNMFMGARLLATSERNLFASGLLPTRTNAEVYRALGLQNEAALVTRERIGGFEYLVAATPLTVRQLGILTVPLASRQREIDQQIDTLDRRALLAALLFILGGAGLGYSMAERISDPVNRLTRATRRIARGDLDARIAATSSDELRRLVEDFNSMAAELQRQRSELERTHRLEAWAEMARQVAHEIKNPLTPIQLNAEHLRRVHADRGEPLSPVLQECVATILTQVKLLRQISSEFSSFASSPTAKRSDVDITALIREILDPYRQGLEGRIRVDVDLPSLPAVSIDRTLVSRALVNIVENALHAMPGTGALDVRASQNGRVIRVRVTDTGVGMDAEALARAFEPYFSTKAAGTGLGLPIAKRNVELSGGTISMTSERDKGTTVEVTLPLA
jgi:signal transduction histidine kinase